MVHGQLDKIKATLIKRKFESMVNCYMQMFDACWMYFATCFPIVFVASEDQKGSPTLQCGHNIYTYICQYFRKMLICFYTYSYNFQ